MCTFAATIPPTPTEKARSSTITRSASSRASRTASIGKGRNEVSPTTPIAAPSSRISSIVSLSVPSTEPMARTTVRAPSQR